MGAPVAPEGGWRRWGLFGVLVAFALYKAVAYVDVRRNPSKVALGAQAPALRIPLISGGGVSLTSESGEVVLLDFWASWCKPCVRSMPELKEVARRLSGEGFRMVLVNQDFGADERRDLVARFAEAHGVADLPMALDPGVAATTWGVSALPFTVLIDGEGVVRHQWTGAERADVMTDLVRALTKDRSP